MDPITLAARVARDLAELHDGGFISEARVQDTLEGLPVRGKANWCVQQTVAHLHASPPACH